MRSETAEHVPISILIAVDHPIIRNSLRVIMEQETDFRVVAEAANGREAVVLADYKQPDVIVLDVTLPHLSGIAAAREILSKRASAHILFVTALPEEAYVVEAFKAGARGYVAADSAALELVDAIRRAVRGCEFISPEVTERLLSPYLERESSLMQFLKMSAAACDITELQRSFGSAEVAELLRHAAAVVRDYNVCGAVIQRAEHNLRRLPAAALL